MRTRIERIERIERLYWRENLWRHTWSTTKLLYRNFMRVAEALLCALVDGHPLYRFNEETGRYEEFNPRMDTKETNPPRIF